MGIVFSDFITTIDNDIETRINIGNESIKFGIDFLDDFLCGIWKQDLVLVGAHSGAGKTQLVTNIALHNVLNGKRVHFFALEADEYEIERRILFNLTSKYYFNDPKRKTISITNADFMLGNIAKQGVAYEIQAINEFKKRFGNLKVAYKFGRFGIKEFREAFLQVAVQGSDLIIIDHAHFFDWGTTNENVALKEIVSAARELNIENKIPVILVSHLRKRSYAVDWYAPPMEEFHGSSELYKYSTKVITLGTGEREGEKTFSTYVNSAKFRADGSRAKAIGKINFNFTNLSYERGYDIGRPYQVRTNEFETFIENDFPAWAKGARRGGGINSGPASSSAMASNTRGAEHVQRVPYSD